MKSSDEDGSPKSAQKKVKLLQPYVVYHISSSCWPCVYFSCLKLIIVSQFRDDTPILTFNTFSDHQRRIQQPCHQLWECAPIWCAGHASGPQRTHLLSVSSGFLRRDDRLWQHWREFCFMFLFRSQSGVTWSAFGIVIYLLFIFMFYVFALNKRLGWDLIL